MVYAVGPISGGHFNPAVTLGLAVGSRLPWSEVLPYWIAQLVGGVVWLFWVAPLARSELAVALPILIERLPGLRRAGSAAIADRYHFRGLTALPMRTG
jgi:hypothetical protein